MENLKIIPLERVCKKCNESKSISEFYNYRDGDRQKYKCKKCHQLRSAAEYKKNHKAYKERQFKYKYGLSSQDIKLVLERQMGLCANRACGKEISLTANVRTETNNRAYVDHCHTTRKVRGLLCLKCNTALGILEQKNFVFGLTEYLHKYS